MLELGRLRPARSPELRRRAPGGRGPTAERAGPASIGFGTVISLLIVAAVFSWWGWERGAYFGVIFLPGAVVLLGLGAALLLRSRWPARLRGAPLVALLSLLALGAWTLVSAIWSPTAETAVEDGQRVLLYGVAFALGMWLCLLLGRRMLLALGPLAAAGALVAVATAIAALVGTDPAELLEEDATLRYPLGYRNAVAAFFLAAALPALALAAAPSFDWRLRGLLLGPTTLMLELAVLSQSRGSLFAVAVGLAVLLALHPARVRVLLWLGAALAPAALALPWLLAVYQEGGGNTAESLPSLHAAGAAMLATALLSAVIGLLLARRDPLIEISRGANRTAGLTLLGAAAAAALALTLAIGMSEGGVVGFIDRQTDELTAGSPDLSEEGSRFGLDLRSERGDLWAVALSDLGGAPLTGEGAGGFRFSYLRERDNAIQPEDPHSVEMLMAGELGLPGLALFAIFMVAAAIGALRARGLGPSAAALSAAALATASYWLVHASVEWFWTWPGVTLPVLFTLGAASAPSVLSPVGALRRTRRSILAAGAVVFGVSLLPFLVSERYTDNALRSWQADLNAAYSELGTAADLNPLNPRPLVTEAVIAEAAGDSDRALAALAEAQERVPEEWTVHYLEARVAAATEPSRAASALARAEELNPEGAEIDQLQAELGQAP